MLTKMSISNSNHLPFLLFTDVPDYYSLFPSSKSEFEFQEINENRITQSNLREDDNFDNAEASKIDRIEDFERKNKPKFNVHEISNFNEKRKCKPQNPKIKTCVGM